MGEDATQLSSTTSLCPVCLERVPGEYEAREGAVHLTRTCPDHGTHSPKVWASRDHWEWAGEFGPTVDGDPEAFHDDSADAEGSGGGCGCGPGEDCEPVESSDAEAVDGAELTVDNDHACLAVVEVTDDCNLSCSFCFASSGPGGPQKSAEEVHGLLETILDSGGPRPVQFSGGEPTVRPDLPDLVDEARDMGFEHVQVNTNGIALATREGYAETLADAGVTAVYLQFDGLTSETYEAIRDVDLLETKRRAIDACREAGLSVVLVPTVVPGVNDDEMGDVVRFALDNFDVIESVNFQPVAHFGRYGEDDAEDRFAIDDAARRLADQFDPLEARDLVPIPCCSSYCQVATALLPTDFGVTPASRFVGSDGLDGLLGAFDEDDWMELLASTPAGGEGACCASGACGVDLPAAADELLDRVLPVSFTGFMDADAADVDRLDNCCISVPTESGELVPFCAYNMTDDDGEYALRNRHGWGGRSSVSEPAVGGYAPGSASSDDD
jgi:uncharacterized radical SAM superfamily Fe-S cluster-containing enzyme